MTADEPTPPPCDWCGEEYATELRNLGHAQRRPNGPWRPTLADLCWPCATEADNERETSIHD